VGALPEVFPGEIAFVDSEDGAPVTASLRQALAAAGPDLGERLRARVARLCDPREVAGRYAKVLRQHIAERRR
jgi:hypothetical protein